MVKRPYVRMSSLVPCWGQRIVRTPPKRPGFSALSDVNRSHRVDVGDRLAGLLDEFDSRAEAAAVAGVVPDQLARYVRGGAKPPLEVIARLAAAKGVSLDWLWSGEGARSASDEEVFTDAPGMVSVPVFDFRVSAGTGEIAESEEPIARVALNRDLLIAHGISPKAPGLTQVGGYSMRPTIDDGDLVVFDRTDREPRDKIYLFRRSGTLLIKELRRRSDGTLTLISHNASYPPEELPRDETDTLEIIGRVGMVFKSV
jgi:phage repressor protein C with HTH and peptisase S24 domain